jgi:hypothetical protein
MTKTPLFPGTRLKIPLRIWLADGEAKIVPATAAVRRPCPTKAEKEGSWPEPPPEMRETFTGFEDLRYMILFSESRDREGLVRVREFRAVWTRWVGSCRKCFAGRLYR